MFNGVIARFIVICGCVFFPAKPNTKYFSAHMQQLLIKLLWFFIMSTAIPYIKTAKNVNKTKLLVFPLTVPRIHYYSRSFFPQSKYVPSSALTSTLIPNFDRRYLKFWKIVAHLPFQLAIFSERLFFYQKLKNFIFNATEEKSRIRNSELRIRIRTNMLRT